MIPFPRDDADQALLSLRGRKTNIDLGRGMSSGYGKTVKEGAPRSAL